MAAARCCRSTILGLSNNMECWKLCTCLIFLNLCTIGALPEDPSMTYDVLYNAGTTAYMEERWFECSHNIFKALEDYRFHQDTLVGCRLKCAYEAPKSNITTSLEFKFLDMAIKKSNCIRRCKSARLQDRPEVEVMDSIKADFDDYKPYDFLQICAFKSEQYERAASAAYTYLMRHPDHEAMQNNVQYYRSMPEVKPSYFRDLEGRVHMDLYQQGIEAYNNEDYPESIKFVEEALRQYYQAIERCFAKCENKYDHESTPEFYNAVADHAIEVIRCYKQCPVVMATYAGNVVDDYLPEHYNYLQFSYYKTKNLKKSIEAVETYLFFKPGHNIMTKNKLYYKGMNGVQKSFFTVRPEAVKHNKKLQEIERMLEFVDQEYRFSDADLDSTGQDIEMSEDPNLFLDSHLMQEFPTPEFLPRNEEYKEIMTKLEGDGMKVVYEEDQLQGESRVVADGILNDEECEQLIDLTETGAIVGDGYQRQEGKSSPHTDFEQFKGLTVLKAAELAAQGLISQNLADVYLKTSQRALDFVNKYFHMKKPLFFDFTHLACRTALSDEVDQTKRQDLSHPVHSDNCHIRPDGSCPRVPPAYVHRDFSAVLYLNDDFDGGDFFFAHNNKTVQQKVRPKCGRIAAFTAGDYHGVQAVTKGRRCALAMWYTFNHAMQETTHAEARTLLKMTQTPEITFVPKYSKSLNGKLEHEKIKSLVDAEDLKVVATEEELNGPERFAADNVLSEEQCAALINLANTGGNTGDGYQVKGRLSPHTDHEKFVGLTVNKAAELASAAKVPIDQVKLYLNASEKGRHLVETYFNLKTPLYFDFTHLVCRTALDANNQQRTDLSHPIHADNCLLQPDNSCKRIPPAYVDRDYSAILYLNDNFAGGEFFFAHTNMSLQSSLKPRCGRLVGFNAGNYHGVKAVLSGQRCAVAMWYTLDPNSKEEAHDVAQEILKSSRPRPLGPPVHGEL